MHGMLYLPIRDPVALAKGEIIALWRSFAGTLPDAWSSFGSVTVLSLKDNNLTGTLPNA